MRLIEGYTQTTSATGQKNSHINRLRETGTIVSPDELKIGGYYLFKEKFGMVALVKIIQDTSTEGWTGFRLKIKRVFYSTWDVPAGTVFEKGFSSKTSEFPTSWHFEPCMLLLKPDKKTIHCECGSLHAESVL